MGFYKSLISAFAGLIVLALFIVSCEEELDTLGDGVIAGEPFVTDKAEFDVFALNKKITAVQTNRLPLYQLGAYNDPIYGRREAKITSQVRFAAGAAPGTVQNSFGNASQEVEDRAAFDDNADTINEEETVTEVTLYIPYQLVPGQNNDSDGDGVINSEDADPDDPTSDTDGDGVNDNEERILGSNPLDPNQDGSEEDFVANTFPISFELDSIYGSETALNQPFNLKVERSSFFLRDLNPEANFEEAQEYYSNTNIPSFVEGSPLFDGEVTISNQQYLIFEDDDPDTEVDESTTVSQRLAPGIRVTLDSAFFQENILDKEGSLDLLNQSNFNNFLKGLHFSVTPLNGDIMLLLDLSRATITLNYEFQDYISTGENEGNIETVEREFVLRLLQNQNNATFGNAVNTFIDEMLPTTIANEIDNGENASRVYLRGGSGVYTEIRLFDEDEANAANIINQIRENNWLINEATISFYVDRDQLDNVTGFVEPPRLYLYNTDTNQPLIYSDTENSDLQASSSLGRFLNYDGILQVDDTGKGVKYSIRVTQYINDLVLRSTPNDKLALALTANVEITAVLEALGSSENASLPVMSSITPLSTVLFGNNVGVENQDKKLKLEISYTQID